MIKKIGVIGAGQMGNGIAHVAALAGFDIKLLDIDPVRLSAAKAAITGNLDRQVRRTIVSAEDRDMALGNIAFGTGPGITVQQMTQAV